MLAWEEAYEEVCRQAEQLSSASTCWILWGQLWVEPNRTMTQRDEGSNLVLKQKSR